MTPLMRRKKLIKPALQLKIVLTLLGTAVLCILIQTIMLSRSLSAVPDLSDEAHAELMSHVPGILLGNLALTLSILIPLVLVIGTLVTFRIAGPVYRFEEFLTSLVAGTQSEPCRLRERDELHELCTLINAATAPLLTREGRGDSGPEHDLEAQPALRPSYQATKQATEQADAVNES